MATPGGHLSESHATDKPHRRWTANPGDKHRALQWGNTQSVGQWLSGQPTHTWKQSFAENGYLVVRDLLTPEEVNIYRDIYNKMLSGEIDTSQHRHDLGDHEARKTKTENICQIMWPSLYVDHLSEQGPLHQRTQAVSRVILGEDMAFDFDMLISKAPGTETLTPWHQDESYWPDLIDKRAVSCWCAMDDVDVDNGCMWFVAGSHLKPLREHRPAQPGVHVLTCNGDESEGTPQPLSAGSTTFHHGRTMHYTRGNSTTRNRRAFITNFRPANMIDEERKANFDHGKNAGVEVIKGTGQGHSTE